MEAWSYVAMNLKTTKYFLAIAIVVYKQKLAFLIRIALLFAPLSYSECVDFEAPWDTIRYIEDDSKHQLI